MMRSEQLKKKAFWFLLPFLCFILYLLCSSGPVLLLDAKKVSYDPIWYSLCMDVIAAMVSGLCYVFVFRKKPRDDFKPMPWFFMAFLVAVILLWISSELMAAFVVHHVSDAGYAAYAEMVAKNTGLYVVLGVFVAPVSEELFFRGVLYNLWKNAWVPVVCAVLSAICFAISHGTLMHLPLTLAFGLFAAFVYELTGRIRYSIAAHMLSNFISFGTVIAIPSVLVSLPAFLALCLVTFSVLFVLWHFLVPIRTYVLTPHLLDIWNGYGDGKGGASDD